MSRVPVLATCLALLTAATAPAAVTWFVDDDLAEYPEADYTNLTHAVNAQNPDGGTITIWLAPGVYDGISSVEVLSISGKDVDILVDEAIPGERVIDGSQTTYGWGLVLTSFEGQAANVSIDGLTFRNCDPAMQVYGGSTLEMTNCIVDACQRGAVVEGASLEVTSSSFLNCQNDGWGGGIRLDGGSVSLVSDVLFYRCSALTGGAIDVREGSQLNLGEDITFQSCSSESGGGGVYISESTLTSITVDGIVTFDDCQSTLWGGAIYGFSSSLDLSRVLMSNCRTGAYGGGAIYLRGIADGEDTMLQMDECAVMDCASQGRGGGLWVSTAANVVLNDTLFIQNFAKNYGGAIRFSDVAIADIIDCPMKGNVAGRNAGAIDVEACGTVLIQGGSFEMNGCGSVWSSYASGAVCSLTPDAADMDVTFDTIEFSGNYLPTGQDRGLIFTWGMTEADLHLVDCDFCSNFVTPVVYDADLNGPGAWDDLGGNVFQEHCSTCPGDLSGDYEVSWLDLIGFLLRWNDLDPVCDLDENGIINTADLLILLESWGPCA